MGNLSASYSDCWVLPALGSGGTDNRVDGSPFGNGIRTSDVSRQLYEADDDVTQLKLDTLRVIQALKRRPDIRIQ